MNTHTVTSTDDWEVYFPFPTGIVGRGMPLSHSLYFWVMLIPHIGDSV